MELKRFSTLIVFYFLLFSLSFGLDVNEIRTLIGGITSVVFILAFVIILLFLGGVIKMPSIKGIPSSLILFVVLVVVLLIVPMYVPYPQYLEIPTNFKITPLPSYAAEVFKMLGLPEEWMYVPAIIYLFILPFVAIYTLVWAFLQSLGILSNVPSSINRVLAFIVAFLTIPMGWFVRFVLVLFGFMGVWSVLVFVATFAVAVFFRGLSVSTREYEEYRKLALRSKQEAQNIIKDLEAAKQGTVDIMKKAISENLEKTKAIDETAHRILNAALLSNDPDEVRKLISEAINKLRKSSS